MRLEAFPCYMIRNEAYSVIHLQCLLLSGYHRRDLNDRARVGKGLGLSREPGPRVEPSAGIEVNKARGLFPKLE